jgi:hypothetical protein
LAEQAYDKAEAASAEKASQLEKAAIEAVKAAEENVSQARKAAAEAKQVVSEIERTAALRADTANDVVAQVLNFSTFGSDEGSGDSFWIKEGTCRYKLCGPGPRYGLLEGLWGFAGIQTPRGQIHLDLNEYDPKSIIFRTTMVTCGTDNCVIATQVVEGDKILTSALSTLVQMPFGSALFNLPVDRIDLNRIERGWKLIYTEYCRGTDKPF